MKYSLKWKYKSQKKCDNGEIQIKKKLKGT